MTYARDILDQLDTRSSNALYRCFIRKKLNERGYKTTGYFHSLPKEAMDILEAERKAFKEISIKDLASFINYKDLLNEKNCGMRSAENIVRAFKKQGYKIAGLDSYGRFDEVKLLKYEISQLQNKFEKLKDENERFKLRLRLSTGTDSLDLTPNELLEVSRGKE